MPFRVSEVVALVFAAFFCLFVGQQKHEIEAANILLIPFGNTSHFLEIDGVGRPLLARGHQVYILFDEQTRLPKAAKAYELITYQNNRSRPFVFSTTELHKMIESSNSGANFTMMMTLVKDICTDMMTDTLLFPKLQSLKLDLVIADNFFAHCFFLVPHKLGVPHIAIGSMLTDWYARVALLPSVVRPSIGLDFFGLHFCEESPDQLSFVRRLCRLAGLTMQSMIPMMFEQDYLHEYAEFTTMQAVRESSALFLVNINFLLAPALPKTPNVEYVGGLTTRPPAPLEPGLLAWMSLAPNVVVVSFGSNIASLPPTTARKLFDAFGRLTSYRFVWRFKHTELPSLSLTESASEAQPQFVVPSNVRLMDWLPQNDLLAHNSTRAFVTHSGNNGQQEALYHGVPMLCFYVFADQRTNAKRVVERGYGKMINIHDFTPLQVVADLSDLLENASYAHRIKKASRIFHSEKHPSERAADAVEHVLKHGSEHLRNKEAYSLRWWEFYMLDVFTLLYFLTLLLLFVAFRVVKFTFRLIFGFKRSDRVGGLEKPKVE